MCKLEPDKHMRKVMTTMTGVLQFAGGIVADDWNSVPAFGIYTCIRPARTPHRCPVKLAWGTRIWVTAKLIQHENLAGASKPLMPNTLTVPPRI